MIDRDAVIRSVESCFDYWLDQHRYLHPLELDKVRQMKSDALALLKEQEAEIRQLHLALDIAKGTRNGIKVKGW